MLLSVSREEKWVIDNGKDIPSFHRISTFEKFFIGLAKCLEDIFGTLVQKHFFFKVKGKGSSKWKIKLKTISKARHKIYWINIFVSHKCNFTKIYLIHKWVPLIQRFFLWERHSPTQTSYHKLYLQMSLLQKKFVTNNNLFEIDIRSLE